MRVVCNNKIIIVNETIASSTTLKNMINIDDDTQIPIIPDKYYEQLHTEFESFDNIEFKLKLYNFLKDSNCQRKSDFICINFEDLKIKISEDIRERVSMLEFYDFLDTDKKFINKLAKEIGIMLEQTENYIEIIPELFSIIIEQHPSICYHPKYKDVCSLLMPKLVKKVMNKENKYASSYYIIRSRLEYEAKDYCRGGNYEHIKYLVDNGYNFDDKTNYNIDSYFLDACASGNLNLVSFIFGLGARISNHTFRKTCEHGKLTVLDFLFDNFSDKILFVELLEIACLKNNLDLVKYLVSKGADIHSSKKLLAKTCSIYPNKNQHRRMDIVKFLVENKYDINGPFVHTINFLDDDTEILEYLYQNGLCIHINDDLLFRRAVKNNHVKICAFLLSKGANVHARGENALALSIVYNYENIDMFKLLVENGADINHRYDAYCSCDNNFICDTTIVNNVLNRDLFSCYSWIRHIMKNCDNESINKRKKCFSDLIDFLIKLHNNKA
jgi:ankyrin repeat protein